MPVLLVRLAGSAADLQECTDQLQYGLDYPISLDLAPQRDALLSLYNSTGGPSWSWKESVTEEQHQLFFALITELVEIGEGLSDPEAYNFTSLLNSFSASDLAALQALSANCTLQQALSFGEILLKHDWDEPGRSYCSWHGELSSSAALIMWAMNAVSIVCTCLCLTPYCAGINVR